MTDNTSGEVKRLSEELSEVKRKLEKRTAALEDIAFSETRARPEIFTKEALLDMISGLKYVAKEALKEDEAKENNNALQ